MLDKKLKEALELLGGKAIISEEGENYIVMSLKEFKKFTREGVEGLTKQELIDRINNDIAAWKFSVRGSQDEIGGLEDLEKVYYEKAE